MDNKKPNIDEIIGHIEGIIMDEKFQTVQRNFFQEHCDIFSNEEENKFEYMDVFEKYLDVVETFITRELTKAVGEVDLCEIVEDLKNKEDFGDYEIYELLLSFTDFLTFKDLMLGFKDEQSGKYVDLKQDLLVTRINSEDFDVLL